MQNTYLKIKKKENNFFFEKKTILITGATGNVGKILSQNYAKLNFDLILTDLNRQKLNKLKNELEKYKVKIHIKECNFGSKKNVISFCNWINKIKSLDVIINNAAYVGSSELKNWNKNFFGQSSENWEEVFRVNLFSIFTLSQKLAKKLKKSKSPSIINISSMYSSIPPKLDLYKNTKINNPAGYSTSKAGLNYLTKWLAVNLASMKIRVNSISPGGIKLKQEKKFVKRYISKTLLGRMTTANDIFKSCLFLSSDMSSHITGQNIILDGGFYIK